MPHLGKGIAYLIGILLLLSGCTRVSCYGTADDIIPRLNLKNIFSGMACEICDNCERGFLSVYGTAAPSSKSDNNEKTPETLMITDFVDLNSLKPGRAGILMAELFKSRLIQSCALTVYQVEFSKFFSLTNDGLIVLTRDAKHIRSDEFLSGNCIVGTYSFSKDRLHVFVKLIDMKTGKINKMVDREISIYCWNDFFSGYKGLSNTKGPERITFEVR